jgi:hypothetical protein
MTTLDPSHNVFRHPSGRHAQAVHEPNRFPDILPSITDDRDGGESDGSIDGEHLTSRQKERLRAKREAVKRVRANVPPMPDLRFEQVSEVRRGHPLKAID